jgi:hypothetical protein
MTTTTQLKTILEKIRVSESTFGGIFARDTLPNFQTITTFPTYLIVNTDNSDGAGLHWVSLYFSSPSQLEFFDSFGLQPRVYGFEFIPTSYNTKRLKSDNTTVCGQYCIFHIYYRLRGYTLDSLLF